jgi:hypothetical protein
MSRILSRPMFRRGGSADGGVTSGLRQGYKHGDVATGAREYVDLVESLAPSRGIGAGNEFLMNLGLNLVSNPPSGNILQTLGTEAKEPFQQFQKASRAQGAGRRDLVIAYLNTLDDDERTRLAKEVDYLMETDPGRFPDKEAALLHLEPEFIRYRKDQSPEETSREQIEADVKDLIDIEKAGFGTTAARAVAEAVGKVMSGDNPDVKRENIDLDTYYMDPEDVKKGRRDPETGVITIESLSGDYYEGDKMYYNYNTDTWYTYQEETGIFLPVNPT